MSEHLSPEDISRWLAGERPPEIERHAGECSACSARLDRMESALGEFRGAMHDFAATQSPAGPRLAWQPRARHMTRWVLAAVSLLVLVSASTYWHARRQQARAAEMARADALLEQVDTEISRAVPQPMEPLVNLVTWASSPTEKNQDKEPQ